LPSSALGSAAFSASRWRSSWGFQGSDRAAPRQSGSG
jgi:hypothetical protein